MRARPQLATWKIEFDDSYPSRETFVQRLAVEPRVPVVDGMQCLSDKTPESHYMLQALLFRPVYLKPLGNCVSRSE